MNLDAADPADPIDYPLITLNATAEHASQACRLKFRIGDVIRLFREHKLDLFALQPLTGPPAYEQLCQIIAAGVANVYPAVTWEEVADRLDLEDLGTIDATVAEAIKKATARARVAKSKAATTQP